jgi:hypothetical protein
MAHTYALGQARTSSAANPITTSYTVAKGDTVVCLMIKVVGPSNRAGGAPTLGVETFTQRNTTQKATTSPEASCEIWDLLNPVPGTYTLTIPNTAANTIRYTLAIGRAISGGRSAFEGASGSNATSTNPTPGAVTVTETGDIGFAITAGGWTSWNPSAQVGTVIANTDDGANGGGEQYILNPSIGSHTLSWTQGNIDDWGAVSAYYKEISPPNFNNYGAVKAGDGISVGERIR